MTSRSEPKRRNASKTRATILDAAKKAFSESSYSSIGIRDIAAMADVSSTLLIRYFGSKPGLFEGALLNAMHLGLQLDDKAGFGKQFTERLVAAREVLPPIMLALAAGDSEARDVAIGVTRQHAVGPLAEWLGPPDAQARALQIIMLTASFALYNRQPPVMPMDNAAERAMTRWLAQTLQAIVDQS